MGLELFNTASRAQKPFYPLDPSNQEVRLYCCGPTVHNYAHIGNFRTFVVADLLHRYLKFRGYKTRFVMNVTDVEDKIIAVVRDNQTDLPSYTAFYENAFFEDFATLRCTKPDHIPHATEHISDIIKLIQRLQERGLAYQAADGSLYFSIQAYRQQGARYGQLTKLNFEKMRPGQRVSHDEYDKEAVADFALWKARTPDDGNVFWESPWGEGRPGWHIECSAMSMKLLGPSFDLHIGGEDLIFPHHEDEIAQSEGAGLQPQGRPFVHYWLHIAHLLVEGKKMSKSLGNFFTLRDLLAKGYSGREIRYLLLAGHYREPLNFTLEGLSGARTALHRLDECLIKLQETAAHRSASPDHELIANVTNALDHDLNTSAAWAAVFDWVRDTNKLLASQQLTPDQAAARLAAWDQIDHVLAVSDEKQLAPPPDLTALADQRQAARQAKDFARADAIRDEIKQRGWTIEDTPTGPRLKPI